MSVKIKVGHVKKKYTTSLSKAGLHLPASHIGRYIHQGKYATCIGAISPVYLASVFEYLCAEIIGLAVNATRNLKKVA